MKVIRGNRRLWLFLYTWKTRRQLPCSNIFKIFYYLLHATFFSISPLYGNPYSLLLKHLQGFQRRDNVLQCFNAFFLLSPLYGNLYWTVEKFAYRRATLQYIIDCSRNQANNKQIKILTKAIGGDVSVSDKGRKYKLFSLFSI